MSTHNASLTVPVQYGDIVTSQQLELFQFIYYKCLSPILEILGIAANVMNLIVFSKLGYKDPIAVSFSILSLVDLLFLLLSSFSDLCRAWSLYISTDFLGVSTLSVAGCLTWYRYLLFDTSTCIETYIAVTRCCCVSMPLKFKNVFTVKKTVIVCSFLFLLNALSYMPVMSANELRWTWNPQKNKTILTGSFNQNFDSFREFNNLFNRTTYPVVALVISCVCASILSVGLLRASRFRNRISSKHDSSRYTADKHKIESKNDVDKATFPQKSTRAHREQFQTSDIIQVKESERNESGEVKISLSGKDLHIVKCVTFVTCNLAFTQLVVSLFALAQAAENEFMILRRFSKTYSLTSNVMNLVIDLHMLVNIFVYYNFNSKYREHFLLACNVLKCFSGSQSMF